MFSLFVYLLLLPVRLMQRARSRRVDAPPAVQVTAQANPGPEMVVAMAEGAQQAHESAVAVDVLIPATDRNADKLADIIDAVGPHAEQAASITLVGVTAHEGEATIRVHFKPTEEDD